ncbi:Smr/MutS family protein [Lentzea albidocapillata]|uniref:Smr/MutS family protein n=1 Tax=Lentzea albidocapillata TaxID=40571 RepID=UPI000A60AF0D|nr:Smr/MutS family protein [Lentzea albidocapillata]
MSLDKLTVDLHPIFRSDQDIAQAVRNALFRAAGQQVPLVEIITGKGAGKLRSRVLAMLKQPHVNFSTLKGPSVRPIPSSRVAFLVHHWLWCAGRIYLQLLRQPSVRAR